MKMPERIALGTFLALAVALFFRLLVGDSVVALLMPRGTVAHMEYQTILRITGIMLVLAIPMLIALYAIAWKYRDDNPAVKYDPDMHASPKKEWLLWVVPFLFVMAMWALVWNGTPKADPYEPIASARPTTTIQVVALRWKWLFIYPEQGVATVNYVKFPADAPVHFDLTADGPMSSFWIPQLGSQIYAMSAMTTQLNLMAKPGVYSGKDTEINGTGYAGMTFKAEAVSDQEFADWVAQTKRGAKVLGTQAYDELAEPTEYVTPDTYSDVDPELFSIVAMKGMMPPMDDKKSGGEKMDGHHDMPMQHMDRMPGM